MLYSPKPLKSPPERRRLWMTIRDQWLKPLLITLVTVALINLFFPRYAVVGHSMEPNLQPDDRLFVTSRLLDHEPLQRGQLVIFTSPYDGETVIKRVIGLPGETVSVYDGVVSVDDKPLEERYIASPPRYTGKWHIPADHYFVLGDNRNQSLDSSRYGAIPMSIITGTVRLRFFPLDHVEVFAMPDYAE